MARGQNGTFKVYLQGFIVHTPEEWQEALSRTEDQLPPAPEVDARRPKHWQLLDRRAILLRQLGEERMLSSGEKLARAAAELLPPDSHLLAVIWSGPGAELREQHWTLRIKTPAGLRDIAVDSALAESLVRQRDMVVEALRRRLRDQLGPRSR
ncbi:MAG: hypothetical protein ACRD01_10080, partial [Terriglobales bacterium]